jgi:hypothetical protein
MTDKKLEKLFLEFANSRETSKAKNRIKNMLAAKRTVKPVWKRLLPAAAAALAIFMIFYARISERKDAWAPTMEYASIYDSPMYVYLINAISEENRL